MRRNIILGWLIAVGIAAIAAMRRKVILGGLIVVGIAAISAWNVNIGSKTESLLSDIALANIEALAQNEGCDEEGWTKLEIILVEKTNGTTTYERVNVDCAEGGPMSSCTQSCEYRHNYHGVWGDWIRC